MEVAFRATCRAHVGARARADLGSLFGDQPTPHPAFAEFYNDPERSWMTWPPRDGDQAAAQRLTLAVFLFGPDRVRLDADRSKFTYTRLTLAGTTLLLEPELQFAQWKGPGPRAWNAADAATTVLTVMRSALSMVYRVDRSVDGRLDDIPLPGLSLSLRELPSRPDVEAAVWADIEAKREASRAYSEALRAAP